LFFVAMGAANLYIANNFFVVESQLQALTGLQDIDLKQCGELFQEQALGLCENAQQLEETWVNFKLFGMMGLTIAFVVAQAFYLARHIKDDEATQES
jgi:intracellular septation protein